MKRRLTAAGIFLVLVFSLCACGTPTGGSPLLKGKKTVYSETISYANSAWGGVEITEKKGRHTLKNQRAQLDFGRDTAGLEGLTSLQTGETLLKNTVITTLTAADGTKGTVTGGTDRVIQGNYGVNHSRTDAAVRIPGNPKDALVWKEYDLTNSKTQAAFSALKHEVSISREETGLKISSEGKTRSQFGARYLDVDLEPADYYYLSVTVKAQGITGLKCYFSTDTAPLTEDTLLGTLDLTGAEEEFVTLTAKIENDLWEGVLQTLLFRLPEGETGSMECSRIALLTLNDSLTEGVADTLWTVYSDRIYFSQSIHVDPVSYTGISTVFSINAAKCKELIETEDVLGWKMIDGSVLGFVRPRSGGTLRLETAEGENRVILDWDLGEHPSVALRIYLNYTDDTEELEQVAAEERAPLTAEDFRLEGVVFDRYDPKGGMYRLIPASGTKSRAQSGTQSGIQSGTQSGVQSGGQSSGGAQSGTHPGAQSSDALSSGMQSSDVPFSDVPSSDTKFSDVSSSEPLSITLKGTSRTVYCYVEPPEGAAWSLWDKNGDRLPLFAGTTFPLSSAGKDVTVKLIPEPSTQPVAIPSFFADSGLLEQSRSVTVLNGLCAQNYTKYASPDGTYSLSLTSTRLKNGRGTIYDIAYDFHTQIEVSDLKETFPIFAFELGYGFEEYFYLNEEHETVTASAGSEAFAYLGSMPYVGLSAGEASAGWLISEGHMTAGGSPSTALLCLRYGEVSEGEPNKLYLSFDQSQTRFVKGDRLTARVIRWDSAPGEESLKALRDGGNFRVIQREDCHAGTVTASGMEETVILQIEGFDHYRFPKLTVKGEDFNPEHHVYVDKNGYYGFAFSVPTGTEVTIHRK